MVGDGTYVAALVPADYIMARSMLAGISRRRDATVPPPNPVRRQEFGGRLQLVPRLHQLVLCPVRARLPLRVDEAVGARPGGAEGAVAPSHRLGKAACCVECRGGMSFRLSFHHALRHTTGRHSLDDPPDLSC